MKTILSLFVVLATIAVGCALFVQPPAKPEPLKQVPVGQQVPELVRVARAPQFGYGGYGGGYGGGFGHGGYGGHGGFGHGHGGYGFGHGGYGHGHGHDHGHHHHHHHF